MEKTNELTWDLDSIFQGGSDSGEFAAYLKEIKASMENLLNPLMNLTQLNIMLIH